MNQRIIPFSCCRQINIPFNVNPPIHLTMIGGDPAERVILYPDGLKFGIFADSVEGSAEIQSGFVIYGDAFSFGIGVRCAEVEARNGKTLYFTDPRTLGELNGMALDDVPFE